MNSVNTISIRKMLRNSQKSQSDWGFVPEIQDENILPQLPWMSKGDEGRLRERVRDRMFDGVKIWLSSSGGNDVIRASLWDYSAGGLGLAVRMGRLPMHWMKEILDVYIQCSGGRIFRCRAKVVHAVKSGKTMRLGLLRLDFRKHDREVPAPEELKVAAADWVFYNRWCGLRLIRPLENSQLLLRMDSEALLLLPGMRMKLHLGVPGNKRAILPAHIDWMGRDPQGTVYICVTCLHWDRNLMQAVSDHFLMHQGFVPRQLIRLGYSLGSLRYFFRGGSLETLEEYAQALALRKNYAWDSEIFGITNRLEGYSLAQDEKAALIGVYQGTTMAANVSLSLPIDRKDSLFQGMLYDVNNCIELYGVSIALPYFCLPVIRELWLQVLLKCRQSGRRYLLAAPNPVYADLFKRLGFSEPLESSVRHSRSNPGGKVLICDLDSAALGLSVAWSTWEVFWRQVTHEIDTKARPFSLSMLLPQALICRVRALANGKVEAWESEERIIQAIP